ncbi:MAG: LegC family aminotransferase [Bacteroidetes bacterium]|nr:LegC family aminotransferase [Bacteroidota bacterium]
MTNHDIISFIRDQFRGHDKISLHQPHFGGKEKEYLNDCITSTFVSSVGPFVDRFEKEITNFTDTKYAVAVVNGTAGLQVALQLVGVENGDEVITQALSFIATSNSIHFAGATPIYVDVDYDTMGMSPNSLTEFLVENAELRNKQCYNKSTGKRIAACLPMHTFGFPCRIDEISEICKKWSIPLVEDAAEALGSEYKQQKIGSFGDLAVFSFNGNKIVTAGGGGVIVTNDEILAKRAKHITTTAKIPHPYEFVHDESGYNFRMPNINAALLCAQLEQLEGFLKNKRKLASKYAAFFNEKPIFRIETDQSKANYWLNCLEFENLSERDSFLVETNEEGITTRPIWTLSFLLPMYKDCWRDSQENATKLYERIVNIPSSVQF